MGTEARRWLGACLLGALVLLAVAFAPTVAEACAVCFGGEENDWTGGFVLGTIVMLALPPMIVVGAGVTIYRAIKRQEAVEAQADAAADAADPKPARG